ncbi:MAG: hypothetical protein ACJ763_02915 [Bdellovibrionia bacterium]
MTKVETNPAYSNGFAVVDTLVAIALVCVGVMGIATFMNYSGRAQFGIEQTAQFFNLKTEIKTILSAAETCTPNFPVTDPNTFTIPKPVTLQRFDYSSGAPVAMTGPDSTIGSVNSKYAALTIVSGLVRKKQQVAPNLFLMAYEVSAARSANASGASVLMTEIPFSMLTDSSTGQVIRCFTDPFTGGSTLLEEFVCMLNSGDKEYFDPVTQKCLSKYNVLPYPGPDQFTAGPCPVGTDFTGCQVLNANGSGGGPPVTESYVGLATPVTKIYPGNDAKEDPSNPGHCVCSYSTSYNFVPMPNCAVNCGTLKPALVNIWPYQPASP